MSTTLPDACLFLRLVRSVLLICTLAQTPHGHIASWYSMTIGMLCMPIYSTIARIVSITTTPLILSSSPRVIHLS
jgi:hypothetical protein